MSRIKNGSNNFLVKRYDKLYFTLQSKNLPTAFFNVFVKRGNRKGEVLDFILKLSNKEYQSVINALTNNVSVSDLHDLSFINVLKKFDRLHDEAVKAVSKDYFLCTKCEKAKHKNKFSGAILGSKYCSDCTGRSKKLREHILSSVDM